MPEQPLIKPETYISVDVETAGPTPDDYSMLSIGACLVDDPASGFYVELKPLTDNVLESSLAVSGLSMERLAEEGLTPVDAMRQSFAARVAQRHASSRIVAIELGLRFLPELETASCERSVATFAPGLEPSASAIKKVYGGSAGALRELVD